MALNDVLHSFKQEFETDPCKLVPISVYMVPDKYMSDTGTRSEEFKISAVPYIYVLLNNIHNSVLQTIY